ncbi:hypothetical protein B4099_1998 [Heyndrickxia coagulans]|uniref:Uncharacterized protein n=1 Tax=Heyndrickxia coagulans TaxID=1398 RepID=A0A150KGS9_HEYCO|nr:hypothetical protein B4099_1998 [Heyndrickxia coagulans]
MTGLQPVFNFIIGNKMVKKQELYSYYASSCLRKYCIF